MSKGYGKEPVHLVITERSTQVNIFIGIGINQYCLYTHTKELCQQGSGRGNECAWLKRIQTFAFFVKCSGGNTWIHTKRKE